MFTSDQYELLDFGNGRRLERFGPVTLDRPCPAAEAFRPVSPKLWTQADARFEGRDNEKGGWNDRCEVPERWNVVHGAVQFELKRTEFGHLGVFPEQAANWDWIAQQCRLPASRENVENLKILNLFAYTGGSTLAAAATGAEVVHVDAAKNVVAWARRNADLSGLSNAPIRWIPEDAIRFVERELKRGNRYDALILDPPSYGHGPNGQAWQLARHLPRLLTRCAELTNGRLQFLLLTCHTPGYDAAMLSDMLKEHFFPNAIGRMKAMPLTLPSIDKRELPSGVVVRWNRKPDLIVKDCKPTSNP